MKIMFYLDWELAITYLKPLYDYIKSKEPNWDLYFHTNNPKTLPLLAGLPVKNIPSDVAFVCDELSVCKEPFKICIFHGLASKTLAFCSKRSADFQNFAGLLAVPSEYYRQKLLGLGVDDNKIFIGGLTKLDGLKEKKILFAPTHNMFLSAIPVIKDRIYELDNVDVHLHPYTETCNDHPIHAEYRSYYHTRDSRIDILDLINECDILIGDFGSILLEGIAIGKQAIQVVNPDWKRWYIEFRGITEEEMWTLPEVELGLKYATQVGTFEELQNALGVVANLGNACKTIYHKVKELK